MLIDGAGMIIDDLPEALSTSPMLTDGAEMLIDDLLEALSTPQKIFFYPSKILLTQEKQGLDWRIHPGLWE